MTVGVLLERRGDTVVLIVEDNGDGFDSGSPRHSEGLGILGMRERATLIGGTLDLESTSGHGTTVYLRWPMPGQRP